MKPEEDEAGMLRVAEGAALKDGGGNNCEAENRYGDDVVGAVGNPAEPAVQSSAADKPADKCGNRDGV